MTETIPARTAAPSLTGERALLHGIIPDHPTDAELRALCEAATPGPWSVLAEQPTVLGVDHSDWCEILAQGHGRTSAEARAAASDLSIDAPNVHANKEGGDPHNRQQADPHNAKPAPDTTGERVPVTAAMIQAAGYALHDMIWPDKTMTQHTWSLPVGAAAINSVVPL